MGTWPVDIQMLIRFQTEFLLQGNIIIEGDLVYPRKVKSL